MAILAIDTLIERVGFLTGIENDLKDVKKSLESSISGRDFFNRRSFLPSFQEHLDIAQEEIWISGITLQRIAAITGDFNKLPKGVKLRFLTIKPDEVVVNETSNYFGLNAQDLKKQVEASLTTLSQRLEAKQNLEIRTSNNRPGIGYFIVDPNSDRGYMSISPYMYKMTGDDKSPIIILKKGDSPWFDIYLEDFEKYWKNGEKWEIQ